MTLRNNRQPAFGRPKIEPRSTGSAKEAVGTAYSASSRVWYNLSLGILDDVYSSTIARPQSRDLRYLVTDGETFFREEKCHLTSKLECLSHHALGIRITNTMLRPLGLGPRGVVQ